MSELKVYRDPKDGLAYREFYEKSEADKVIAHNKYKRCLAMARIAQDDWHLHNSFYAMGHHLTRRRNENAHATA